MQYISILISSVIVLIALDILLANEYDPDAGIDGQELLRKLFYHASDAAIDQKYFMFTAPVRICQKYPCDADDDLKLLFPIYVGEKGRKSFTDGLSISTPAAGQDGGGKDGTGYLDDINGLRKKTTPMYLLFNSTCDDADPDKDKKVSKDDEGDGKGDGEGNEKGDGEGDGKKDSKEDGKEGNKEGKTQSTKSIYNRGDTKSTLSVYKNGKQHLRVQESDFEDFNSVRNNQNYNNYGIHAKYHNFRPVKDFK